MPGVAGAAHLQLRRECHVAARDRRDHAWQERVLAALNALVQPRHIVVGQYGHDALRDDRAGVDRAFDDHVHRAPAHAHAGGDGVVDAGPIIAQAVVPVLPDDDVASLHDRIQRTEHVLLPRVITAIAHGDVTLAPELRVRSGCDAQQALFSFA